MYQHVYPSLHRHLHYSETNHRVLLSPLIGPNMFPIYSRSFLGFISTHCHNVMYYYFLTMKDYAWNLENSKTTTREYQWAQKIYGESQVVLEDSDEQPWF